MSDFTISFRSLRDLINTLNFHIITQDYDQVSSIIDSVLPQIQIFIDDKAFLSKALVNFDFYGLFSYLHLMEQKDLDLENIIFFLSIACQAHFFEPKCLLNKQNLLLIFSLLKKYSDVEHISTILLTILCKLTTPYSLSYVLFINNDLIQQTVEYKNCFPISHIFYHVVLSAFHDDYKIEKKYSIAILQSSLRSLQAEENFYENDDFFYEEISFSLKLFGIYLEHSIFPIDFNPNILVKNSQYYLSGPEIIQESFLDFLLGLDSIDLNVLEEIIPFILESTEKSSLTVIKIFKKALLDQENDENDDDDDESEEEEENFGEDDDKNAFDLTLFPGLVDIIPELYQRDSKIIQDEAFQIVIELCKLRMINQNIIQILTDRIVSEFDVVEIISDLIDDFDASKDGNVGGMAVDDFYESISNCFDKLISLQRMVRMTKYSKKLVSKICDAISGYQQLKEKQQEQKKI